MKILETRYEDIFSRNIGVFTQSEQEILRTASLGIAGMGGVGGLLAERLIRLGIGKLKITDPGAYEASNLNRQYSSSTLKFGQNKAESVYSQLKDINPEARLIWDPKGIKTEMDAVEFAAGCDVVIDEMDLGMFRQNIYLHRAAKRNDAYYFFTSAIGFGALIVIFDPAGMSLAEYNGLPSDVDVENPDNLRVGENSLIPTLPSYFKGYSNEDILQILRGKKPGSAIAIGAGLAAVLAANEAVNIILKKRRIILAPEYTYIDLFEHKFIIGRLKN